MPQGIGTLPAAVNSLDCRSLAATPLRSWWWKVVVRRYQSLIFFLLGTLAGLCLHALLLLFFGTNAVWHLLRDKAHTAALPAACWPVLTCQQISTQLQASHILSMIWYPIRSAFKQLQLLPY